MEEKRWSGVGERKKERGRVRGSKATQRRDVPTLCSLSIPRHSPTIPDSPLHSRPGVESNHTTQRG